MDLFMSMEAFVRAAEAQSFANAARQLGVAKSVVTSRVKQLEDHFGVPLFHRSTRAVRLSELGETYYRECVELVNRAHELSGRSRGEPHSLSGTLNIHVLPGFALGHFSQALIEFRETYPRVEFVVTVNDRVIDPVQEGFDLALQIYPPASNLLVERRLFRRIVRRSRLPEGRTGHRDAARPAASRLRLLFVLPVGRQVAADEGQRYLRNRT
jgi:DNA-binding transcriptional LysR family regulator